MKRAGSDDPNKRSRHASGMALRSLSSVLTAVSDKGVNLSSDGSSFALDISSAPLNIPSHATNVHATLISAVIPAYGPLVGANPLPLVMLEADFAYGGVNQLGQISQIMSMIPVDPNLTQGDYIHVDPGTPVRIPCSRMLKGTNPQSLTFRLVNSDRAPVAIGTTKPWAVQVLVEWEQEIDLDQLRGNFSETQYY